MAKCKGLTGLAMKGLSVTEKAKMCNEHRKVCQHAVDAEEDLQHFFMLSLVDQCTEEWSPVACPYTNGAKVYIYYLHQRGDVIARFCL